MIQPPDWIDPEAWCAFHQMRAKIKAPLTAYAEKLIIGELVKLKGAGHDPQECLDQSIRNGYRDVFAPKDKGLTVPAEKRYFKAPEPMTSAELASSERARKAALSAVKVTR